MAVNFRAHEISRGARKLAWISTLIIIKKDKYHHTNTNIVQS